MASPRDEPLSKEEQEEEIMRNELADAGLWEPNMSTKDMKEIWGVLKESNADQNNEQYTEYSSSSNTSILSQNTSGTMKDSSNMVPVPSFSYTNAVTSGSSTVQSTCAEKQLNKQEKSPELALNIYYGKNLNNENFSLDHGSNYENNYNLNNDYPKLNESKSNLKNNTNDRSYSLRLRENKKATPSMLKNSNLHRWNLNPFYCLEDESVAPLKQPERLHMQLTEPMPYSDKEINKEEFEELFQRMSAKLESLHMQYNKWDESITKPQWGAPIKAATKWNGSLDKNPVKEKSPLRSSHNPDILVRESHDRATKRKALCNIAAAIHDQINDENSDDEFVITKKRKFQQEKKAEEGVKINQESQKNKASSSVEMIEVDDTKDLSDLEMFDNSSFRSLYKSSKVEVPLNAESIEEHVEYPRRISPPNPSKKKFFKGPRAKKNNSTQSQNKTVKDKFLTDEEISKSLHVEDINDSDCIDITDEIKPSPMPKKLTNKIQIARSHLENALAADELRIKTEEAAKIQREKREALDRDYRISKRLQEEEDENNRRVERDKKANEQENFYRDFLKSNASKVTKKNIAQLNKTNEKGIQNSQLNNDDDDDDDEPKITHTNLAISLCPICQKPFPQNQIDRHAWECVSVLSESDEISNHQPSSSRSSSDHYECQICNEYSTSNGRLYEEHVVKCKERDEDRRIEGYLHGNISI